MDERVLEVEQIGHCPCEFFEGADASPERRRIRGRTAQHVLTALLVAAANIRKIRTWLDNAETVDNEPHTPGHVKKRAAARKRRESLREHLPLPPDL